MAEYIYLVRYKNGNDLLAAFTVKKDAHEWVQLRGLGFAHLKLSRMRDGNCYAKTEHEVHWDETQQIPRDSRSSYSR